MGLSFVLQPSVRSVLDCIKRVLTRRCPSDMSGVDAALVALAAGVGGKKIRAGRLSMNHLTHHPVRRHRPSVDYDGRIALRHSGIGPPQALRRLNDLCGRLAIVEPRRRRFHRPRDRHALPSAYGGNRTTPWSWLSAHIPQRSSEGPPEAGSSAFRTTPYTSRAFRSPRPNIYAWRQPFRRSYRRCGQGS